MASKLDALQQKMNDLYEQIRTEGQTAFNEAVKEIFDKYPGVEAFRWTQYTPYFNDGDTCTFGVNTDVDIKLFNPPKDENGDDQGDGEGWFQGWDLPEVEGAHDAASDFEKCLQITDLMLSLFGDHVQVTCYRDRIEVEEYQHD